MATSKKTIFLIFTMAMTGMTAATVFVAMTTGPYGMAASDLRMAAVRHACAYAGWTHRSDSCARPDLATADRSVPNEVAVADKSVAQGS